MLYNSTDRARQDFLMQAQLRPGDHISNTTHDIPSGRHSRANANPVRICSFLDVGLHPRHDKETRSRPVIEVSAAP